MGQVQSHSTMQIPPATPTEVLGGAKLGTHGKGGFFPHTPHMSIMTAMELAVPRAWVKWRVGGMELAWLPPMEFGGELSQAHKVGEGLFPRPSLALGAAASATVKMLIQGVGEGKPPPSTCASPNPPRAPVEVAGRSTFSMDVLSLDAQGGDRDALYEHQPSPTKLHRM